MSFTLTCASSKREKRLGPAFPHRTGGGIRRRGAQGPLVLRSVASKSGLKALGLRVLGLRVLDVIGVLARGVLSIFPSDEPSQVRSPHARALGAVTLRAATQRRPRKR